MHDAQSSASQTIDSLSCCSLTMSAIARREVEEVPNARERLGRALRDPAEAIAGVSEALSEGSPQLEVIVALRLLGHMAVHVLDLRLELLGVDRRLRHRSSLVVVPQDAERTNWKRHCSVR